MIYAKSYNMHEIQFIKGSFFSTLGFLIDLLRKPFHSFICNMKYSNLCILLNFHKDGKVFILKQSNLWSAHRWSYSKDQHCRAEVVCKKVFLNISQIHRKIPLLLKSWLEDGCFSLDLAKFSRKLKIFIEHVR